MWWVLCGGCCVVGVVWRVLCRGVVWGCCVGVLCGGCYAVGVVGGCCVGGAQRL